MTEFHHQNMNAPFPGRSSVWGLGYFFWYHRYMIIRARSPASPPSPNCPTTRPIPPITPKKSSNSMPTITPTTISDFSISVSSPSHLLIKSSAFFILPPLGMIQVRGFVHFSDRLPIKMIREPEVPIVRQSRRLGMNQLGL